MAGIRSAPSSAEINPRVDSINVVQSSTAVGSSGPFTTTPDRSVQALCHHWLNRCHRGVGNDPDHSVGIDHIAECGRHGRQGRVVRLIIEGLVAVGDEKHPEIQNHFVPGGGLAAHLEGCCGDDQVSVPRLCGISCGSDAPDAKVPHPRLRTIKPFDRTSSPAQRS